MYVFLMLACSPTEGTPVDTTLVTAEATAAPEGATPITHQTVVEICDGDAKAEVAVTSAQGEGGEAVLVSVSSRLTENRGWAVEASGGTMSKESGELTFRCKRNEASSQRKRETKVRVTAGGKVENLQQTP